jgi:hypothetical protein
MATNKKPPRYPGGSETNLTFNLFRYYMYSITDQLLTETDIRMPIMMVRIRTPTCFIRVLIFALAMSL